MGFDQRHHAVSRIRTCAGSIPVDFKSTPLTARASQQKKMFRMGLEPCGQKKKRENN